MHANIKSLSCTQGTGIMLHVNLPHEPCLFIPILARLILCFQSWGDFNRWGGYCQIYILPSWGAGGERARACTSGLSFWNYEIQDKCEFWQLRGWTLRWEKLDQMVSPLPMCFLALECCPHGVFKCSEVKRKGREGASGPGRKASKGTGRNLLRCPVQLSLDGQGGWNVSGTGVSSLRIFSVSFGMTHLGCDEMNSAHRAVGKVFPVMTQKHGLVILKKQSTSSFHTNNVTQTWSRAKVFYE